MTRPRARRVRPGASLRFVRNELPAAADRDCTICHGRGSYLAGGGWNNAKKMYQCRCTWIPLEEQDDE